MADTTPPTRADDESADRFIRSSAKASFIAPLTTLRHATRCRRGQVGCGGKYESHAIQVALEKRVSRRVRERGI